MCLDICVSHTLEELIDNVVEEPVAVEKEEMWQGSGEFLLPVDVSANLALKVVRVEGDRDEARKETTHQMMRVNSFQKGNKVVETKIKRLLEEGFEL